MQTALNALTAGFSPDEPGVIVMVRTDNGATWYSCRGMVQRGTAAGEWRMWQPARR